MHISDSVSLSLIMSVRHCSEDYKNFNDCEVRFENSVTRVTVWHHEACRVCRTVFPRDEIFNSHIQDCI